MPRAFQTNPYDQPNPYKRPTTIDLTDPNEMVADEVLVTAAPIKESALRPDIAALYRRLENAGLPATPEQKAAFNAEAKKKRNQSALDLVAGMALSSRAGADLAPTGRMVTQHALTNADAPDYVDNPQHLQDNEQRALLQQIGILERTQDKDEALAQRAADQAVLMEDRKRHDREVIAGQNERAKEANEMRRLIAEMANAGRIGAIQERGKVKDNEPTKPSPAAQKEQADLAQAMESADQAIAEVKSNSGAFGFWRGVPSAVAGPAGESIVNRGMSDEEIKARASVFNNVSAVIKQRAGTAQSAAELAVLNSFLPSKFDNDRQILAKMEGYKKFLQGQAKSHIESVTAPPPAKKGGPGPVKPAAPTPGVINWEDLPRRK